MRKLTPKGPKKPNKPKKGKDLNGKNLTPEEPTPPTPEPREENSAEKILREAFKDPQPPEPEPDKEPDVKEIKVYPKAPCVSQGCRNNAVGSGDLCKKHGGDPIIRENLMTQEETPSWLLARSKYDPAFHPMQLIQKSKEGKSDVEVAAYFEVSLGTMRGWAEKYQEFNTAYEVGAVLYEAWWLQEGKENLDNRNYNVGLYKFITGNKLGYSDKMESKNLTVTAGVLMVPGQMENATWEAKGEEFLNNRGQ